ncbi:hypothetical protein, partial [Acinetobacter baumannii]|uniref:hypothetical protein n=1 Tax=Acinetobacter baumannii TaxID=470 RepID=UPI001BC8828C
GIKMKNLISTLIKKVEKIIGYFKYLFLFVFNGFFELRNDIQFSQKLLMINNYSNVEKSIIFSDLKENRRR